MALPRFMLPALSASAQTLLPGPGTLGRRKAGALGRGALLVIPQRTKDIR